MTQSTIDPASVIAKCQEGIDISYEEYCSGAARTLSNNFYESYNQSLALAVLKNYIEAGQLLDELKKALFYGKNLEAVADKHRTLLGFRGYYLQDYKWSSKVDPRLIHAILGMATEDVELVENLYKALDRMEPLDAVNIAEEIGDHEWYKAIVFNIAREVSGVVQSLQNVWRTNLLKLFARYGEKFTSERAINRDLEAERALLEAQVNEGN